MAVSASAVTAIPDIEPEISITITISVGLLQVLTLSGDEIDTAISTSSYSHCGAKFNTEFTEAVGTNGFGVVWNIFKPIFAALKGSNVDTGSATAGIIVPLEANAASLSAIFTRSCPIGGSAARHS